jgi:hypothetical protein
MSLIAGSQGLIYFVHEFKPKFIEAGLLAHDQQAKAVAELNRQIQSLAPVLNSPTVEGAVKVRPSNADAPVSIMVKKDDRATYVFAAAMREKETAATFELVASQASSVDVIDENRTIPIKSKTFADTFKGYEVHLYCIK